MSPDKSIKDYISPQTLGILWLSDRSLLEFSDYFYELDYLLDGLLTNYHHQIAKDRKTTDKNFFVSQSFGGPFFLGHLIKDGDKGNANKDYDEIISMASALNSEKIVGESRNNILLLGDVPKSTKQYLEKSFKKYKFETMDS